MPQTSNVLSFVPVANTEQGQRRHAAPPPRPGGVEDDAVLRKIAEAALSATGADGAALAMRRDGEVICVARAGEMAPPLEARLSDSSGISGACFHEGEALRCDDTATDSRVDAEACRSLGLRSLAVAAVHQGGSIVGILEVFSENPSTFTDRHLEVLRQLAELVIVEQETEPADQELAMVSTSPPEIAFETPQPRLLHAKAAEELPVPAAQVSVVQEVAPAPTVSAVTPLPADVNISAYMAAHEKAKTQGPVRIPNIVLVGLAVITVSSFVGWYLQHRKWSEAVPTATLQTAAPIGTAGALSPNPSTASATAGLAESGSKPSAEVSPPTDSSVGKGKNANGTVTNAASKDRIARNKVSSTKAEHVVPPPSADVDEEADRAPALPTSSGTAKPSETFNALLNTPTALPSRAPPISQGVEGGELETQVSAIYPPQARAAGQHGTVVLELLVAPNGSVKDVKVVSGPPMLRQAAMDAVRRWKYSPFRLNGKPISAQTQVQVDFKLQ